MIQHTSSYL